MLTIALWLALATPNPYDGPWGTPSQLEKVNAEMDEYRRQEYIKERKRIDALDEEYERRIGYEVDTLVF